MEKNEKKKEKLWPRKVKTNKNIQIEVHESLREYNKNPYFGHKKQRQYLAKLLINLAREYAKFSL